MMEKLDITKKQFHDVLRRLEDKINVLESKYDEKAESTKQQITQINRKIGIRSDHIHDVFTPRHERRDFESTEGQPTNTRKSIGNFIKGLVESSTLHGLPRLTVKGNIWKTFWSLLLIGAIGFSVLQIVGLVGSYFEYPMYVDVIPHSTEPTFPQITVCMLMPYKTRAVKRHPLFENRTNVDDIRHYSDILDLISKLPEQERIRLGYEASDVLKAVSYTEGMSSPSVIIPSVLNHPYEGNCYVINPPMDTTRVVFRFNANIDTSMHYIGKDVKKIGYVLLNQQGFSPFHSELQNRVILNSYSVFTSSFRLDVYNRLNGVYGGCQDDEELFQQRTGFNYTRDLCLKECKLKNAQTKCGCLHREFMTKLGFKVPELSDMRMCSSHDSSSDCYLKEYRALTNCHCKDKCIESVYTVKTSAQRMSKYQVSGITVGFPTEIGFNHVAWSRMNNYAMFKLEFAESRYKEFKQQPLYPLSRLMSDLGGTLGFYLGASILTLFEFIHMLSGLIVFVFKRRTTE